MRGCFSSDRHRVEPRTDYLLDGAVLSANLFSNLYRTLGIDVADYQGFDVGMIGEQPSVKLAYPASS
jgi:hypothetical protein